MRKTLLVIVALLAVACSDGGSGGDDAEPLPDEIVGLEPVQLDCPEPAVVAGEFTLPKFETDHFSHGCTYFVPAESDEVSDFRASFDAARAEREADALDWMARFAEDLDDAEVITATDELVVLRSHDPGTSRFDPHAKGGPTPSSTTHVVHVRNGLDICSAEVRRRPNRDLDEATEAAAEARASEFCLQIAA